ncbi:hypothetical protein KKI24_15665 [bacterium]|nr:hypothetical protein [bacterium]
MNIPTEDATNTEGALVCSSIKTNAANRLAIGKDPGGDNLFEKDALFSLFDRKKQFKKRSYQEQALLLVDLNAKAFALTVNIATNGITVERGQGYYAGCSRENAEKIEMILSRGVHPKKYKLLDHHLFIPERIAVDAGDLENEIPEAIHGSLRHEIGEVKYNDWQQFILRQYAIEQKCRKGEMGKGWGKDYGYFINGVGDPRINYLVSRDSEEARRDIIVSELQGIIGLLGAIGGLPRHHQFLMLANCREAETYAPDLVNLIKKEADPIALQYYNKHKRLLTEMAEAEDILLFYSLANQLWIDYARNIVACDADRELEKYCRLSELWPMPSNMGALYDGQNGVVVPIPDERITVAASVPGVQWENRVGPQHPVPPRDPLNEEKMMSVCRAIEAHQEDEQRKNNLRGLPVSGIQERAHGKGRKSGKKSRKRNHHQRFCGSIDDLSNRFANNVHEFTPKQASDVAKRQNQGNLSVRSYISTQGRAKNIYTQLKPYLKYYAVFSVIVDTSFSMQGDAEGGRSKIDYTKDAAYAFCDGLSKKNIPFELLTYGSEDSTGFELEIIHLIDDLGHFSTPEKRRFAAITATGGQADVWALESSGERLFQFAREQACTPFFVMICDGCAGFELKTAVRKMRRAGAVVVGIGIKLNHHEKEEFNSNFGNAGIFVDDMKQLVKAMTDKLKVERNRLLLTC